MYTPETTLHLYQMHSATGKAVYGNIMMGARLCMCIPFPIQDIEPKERAG